MRLPPTVGCRNFTHSCLDGHTNTVCWDIKYIFCVPWVMMTDCNQQSLNLADWNTGLHLAAPPQLFSIAVSKITPSFTTPYCYVMSKMLFFSFSEWKKKPYLACFLCTINYIITVPQWQCANEHIFTHIFCFYMLFLKKIKIQFLNSVSDFNLLS